VKLNFLDLMSTAGINLKRASGCVSPYDCVYFKAVVCYIQAVLISYER
jgi:hypothetical protein